MIVSGDGNIDLPLERVVKFRWTRGLCFSTGALCIFPSGRCYFSAGVMDRGDDLFITSRDHKVHFSLSVGRAD